MDLSEGSVRTELGASRRKGENPEDKKRKKACRKEAKLELDAMLSWTKGLSQLTHELSRSFNQYIEILLYSKSSARL